MSCRPPPALACLIVAMFPTSAQAGRITVAPRQQHSVAATPPILIRAGSTLQLAVPATIFKRLSLGTQITGVGFQRAAGPVGDRALRIDDATITLAIPKRPIGQLSRLLGDNMAEGSPQVVYRGPIAVPARRPGEVDRVTIAFETGYVHAGGDLLVTIESRSAPAASPPLALASMPARPESGQAAIGGDGTQPGTVLATLPVTTFEYQEVKMPTEPGTFALMAAGFALFVSFLRYRSRSREG